MFESLKKKFSSWLGKEDKETAGVVAEKKKESERKGSSKKLKKEKSKIGKAKSEKIKSEKIEEELKEEKLEEKEVLEEGLEKLEEELKEEESVGEKESEKTEEKRGFFGRIFKKGRGEEKKEVLEEKEKEPGEKRGFFAKIGEKITTSELKKEDFNELFEELEFTLLENNVALEAVDKIKDSLSKSLVGQKFKKEEVGAKIRDALRKAIESVLVESPSLIEMIKKKEGVFVILLFGINGSGKTTSAAKLAYKLKKEGISCVLGAGDTFRAASIEQLKTHGEKLGVHVVSKDYGSDPAAVAFDTIQYAKKHHIKVVLIDSAGRMYTKANLMREMEKIVRVSKPDLKIFVGESITGNDATEQAKMFNETAGIDGIILTKADVDEKAGTILSVSYATGKPIYFLGVGQKYEDLKEFRKEDVLKGLGLD
ncbi:MAG: signal recognition particle-docking protein FtsY [Nanoarchaeota archaeon]